MMKRVILAAALGAALCGAARAETATTPDECLKQAFDIAKSAEDKTLTEADLDAFEAMLSKMEAHCDADEFEAADKVGADIKAMLAAK
ncbi:MAG: hypothetical protein ACK4MF_06825 [Hyphomicrobiaceae bacterium]